VTVTYETRGRVAIISIVRPDVRNAVDRATARALGAAWHRFDDDDHVDVGILYGAGGNFSAGADLKAMDLEDHPDGFLGFTRMEVGKPTIAAVEGYAVAGGLEMALWCDLRVAASSAVFGCFERRFGVPLVDGGTQRLPRIIGEGLALELILTGRPVEAEEAHAVGLVNTVVGDGESLAYAVLLAERIADAPQPTVRSDRLALLQGSGRPMEEALEIERQHGLNVIDLAAEGAARFVEGAGRSGVPTTLSPPPTPEHTAEVIQIDDEDELEVIEDGAASHLRIPTTGVGKGALVLDGPGSEEMADRLVELGYVVEVAKLGGDGTSESSLAVIQTGLETLLHSGVVVGEQVAIVAAGEAAGAAMWASTLETRIGAVVVFGPVGTDSERPGYRLADAAYMGHHGAFEDDGTATGLTSLESSLRDLGLDATFHMYRRAMSRFFDPSSEHYDPEMTDLAWKRTRLFLKRAI
jgi:enoyl-CoA hydratase